MENNVENNMNIPNISVKKLTNILCDIYTNAVRKGVAFKNIPTPFLWGPAGVGKSESVKLLADKLSQSTGLRVNVTDVRLMLFSPIDLRGVPVADGNKEFTNWLKPKIFDMDSDEKVVNILFLDELSASPQSVQAAAYQICLDRKVGEHKLNDNCIVVAAGNRTTDKSVSFKMPKALCNRLMHFNITTDFYSWKEWAISNDVDSRIVEYLSFERDSLCVVPESSDLAYPTPRSWSFVNTILKEMNCKPEYIKELISSCIGVDTANSFCAYCETYELLPKIESIIDGSCTTYPKSHDSLYVLVSSLVSTIKSSCETITTEELENCCSYAKMFPPDFASLFFDDVMEIECLNHSLMKCPSLRIWISKNKNFI